MSHGKSAEGKFPTQNMDSVRSPGAPTDTFDDKKLDPKAHRIFRLQVSRKSGIIVAAVAQRGSGDIEAAVMTALNTPTYKQDSSKSGLTVLLPVSERYQTTAGYRSYCLIHVFQWCKDAVASEPKNVRKRVTVQLKVQAFIGKYSAFSTNLLTELKWACDFLPIHEGSVFWLFRKLKTGTALAAIKTRFTATPYDASQSKATVTFHEMLINYLLRRYATDTVIVNAEKKMRIAQRGSLTRCTLSRKL